MKTYTSEKECLVDAIQIQSACNPIAIAGTLRAMVKFLTDEKGTDFACTHPATRAVIGKLCSLTDIEHDGLAAYKELPSLDELSDK